MKPANMLRIISIVMVVFIGLIFVKPSPHLFVFNKASAERDIKYHTVKLITYGLVGPDEQSQLISQKYGFSQYHMGCIIMREKDSEEYQSIVENYLNKRNGIGWEVKYHNELDSLSKMNIERGL